MIEDLNLPEALQKELKKKVSLIRLAKTGFFKKADVPHPSIAKELLLHRMVLDKALIDSFHPRKEIRKEVEDWLDLNNEDFILCCQLALLEPISVFNSFKFFKGFLKGKKAKFNKFNKK